MGVKKDKASALSQVTKAKQKELSQEGLEGGLARLRHAEKHSYTCWTESGTVTDLKAWHNALDLLRRAEANLLEVLQKRRELIPAGEVKEFMGRQIEAAKAKLLDLPGQLSPGLEGLPWPDIQRQLEREIREALHGLSKDI